MKNATENLESEEYKSQTLSKLIHVGNPFKSSELDLFVIPCYFQPWLSTENSPAKQPVFIRNVNSTLAGELVCGSLWTDSRSAINTVTHTSSASHIFWTGTNKLSAVLIKNVLNPEALTPSSFWTTKGDTWVVCIEFNNKTFVIPYFELLRVLFYGASRRLTYFFLSFLPLKLLCQPLNSTNENNSAIIRYFVACQQLTELEARIIGGLLFDPALKNMYDISQNHWLNAQDVKTIQTKSIGRFSKNILFSANGHEFTHNCKQFIWVESLQIVNSPYNFQEVLFHPIKDKKAGFRITSNSLICSDLLQDGTDYSRVLELYPCSRNERSSNSRLSNAKKERAKKYLVSRKSILPKVTCMPPWCSLPRKPEKFFWLDRQLSASVQTIEKEYYKKIISSTHDFRNLLTLFKAKGYTVNNVTLNNPQGSFGQGVSVFPINNHAPLPINAYRGSAKLFTLAKISFSEGPVYLVQPFPKDNANLILLCQKQDLSEPKESEWNKLFSILQPIHNYKNYANFYKCCAALNRSNVSTNSALIALAIPINEITVELCISFNEHLISRFRKRLQFHLSSFLKYPKGMDCNQRNEVIRLSCNICKAPDSLWISRISSYWAFK
jgi:hypothetical protein